MTPNTARLLCHSCGFPLVTIDPARRHAEVTLGVLMTVHLTEQKTRLICPVCLTGRWLSDVTFSAMAVPKRPIVA